MKILKTGKKLKIFLIEKVSSKTHTRFFRWHGLIWHHKDFQKQRIPSGTEIVVLHLLFFAPMMDLRHASSRVVFDVSFGFIGRWIRTILHRNASLGGVPWWGRGRSVNPRGSRPLTIRRRHLRLEELALGHSQNLESRVSKGDEIVQFVLSTWMPEIEDVPPPLFWTTPTDQLGFSKDMKFFMDDQVEVTRSRRIIRAIFEFPSFSQAMGENLKSTGFHDWMGVEGWFGVVGVV